MRQSFAVSCERLNEDDRQPRVWMPLSCGAFNDTNGCLHGESEARTLPRTCLSIPFYKVRLAVWLNSRCRLAQCLRTRLRARVTTAEAACSGGHCGPKASNLTVVWTFPLLRSSPGIFDFSPWTLAISNNSHYCMLQATEQNSNEVPDLIRALQPPTDRCPFHQTPRRLQE